MSSYCKLCDKRILRLAIRCSTCVGYYHLRCFHHSISIAEGNYCCKENFRDLTEIERARLFAYLPVSQNILNSQGPQAERPELIPAGDPPTILSTNFSNLPNPSNCPPRGKGKRNQNQNQNQNANQTPIASTSAIVETITTTETATATTATATMSTCNCNCHGSSTTTTGSQTSARSTSVQCHSSCHSVGTQSTHTPCRHCPGSTSSGVCCEGNSSNEHHCQGPTTPCSCCGHCPARSHHSGPHSAGPHSAGPHSAGPHSAGPHSAGSMIGGHHWAKPNYMPPPYPVCPVPHYGYPPIGPSFSGPPAVEPYSRHYPPGYNYPGHDGPGPSSAGHAYGGYFSAEYHYPGSTAAGYAYGGYPPFRYEHGPPFAAPYGGLPPLRYEPGPSSAAPSYGRLPPLRYEPGPSSAAPSYGGLPPLRYEPGPSSAVPSYGGHPPLRYEPGQTSAAPSYRGQSSERYEQGPPSVAPSYERQGSGRYEQGPPSVAPSYDRQGSGRYEQGPPSVAPSYERQGSGRYEQGPPSVAPSYERQGSGRYEQGIPLAGPSHGGNPPRFEQGLSSSGPAYGGQFTMRTEPETPSSDPALGRHSTTTEDQRLNRPGSSHTEPSSMGRATDSSNGKRFFSNFTGRPMTKASSSTFVHPRDAGSEMSNNTSHLVENMLSRIDNFIQKESETNNEFKSRIEATCSRIEMMQNLSTRAEQDVIHPATLNISGGSGSSLGSLEILTTNTLIVAGIPESITNPQYIISCVLMSLQLPELSVSILDSRYQKRNESSFENVPGGDGPGMVTITVASTRVRDMIMAKKSEIGSLPAAEVFLGNYDGFISLIDPYATPAAVPPGPRISEGSLTHVIPARAPDSDTNSSKD